MLGLPGSTEVNRRVAKEKLYANATLAPQTRDAIKDQIESLFWRNKLTDKTAGINAGETVKEIQVLEAQLRQRGLDNRALSAIAKAIPYKTVLVLTFNNEAQAWIDAAGTFYGTDWQPIDGLSLKFEGLTLDAVYENIARQIAGGRLGTDGDIEEAVTRDKQRQKLERDIAALERKIQSEKQFNKQVEMNAEVKRLKKIVDS